MQQTPMQNHSCREDVPTLLEGCRQLHNNLLTFMLDVSSSPLAGSAGAEDDASWCTIGAGTAGFAAAGFEAAATLGTLAFCGLRTVSLVATSTACAK